MSDRGIFKDSDAALSGKRGSSSFWPRRTIFAGIFVTLQTFLLYFVYTTDVGYTMAHLVPDDMCEQMSNGWRYCQGASWLASRPFLVIATLFVLLILPDFRRRYRDALMAVEAQVAPTSLLALSIAGCILMLVPYFLVASGQATPDKIGPLPILVGGMTMVGAAFIWLANPIQLVRTLGWPVAAATAFLVAFPELSQPLSDGFWREDWLQSATFETAQWLIALMTDSAIDISRAENVIRVGDFAARIGHPCAGLSGIAFSSLTMSGYIFFSRDTLRVGRALLAIPFVALMSWAFNSVRIALLLLIGAHWSPELAADGFHSYAGWISFTLLTGGTILAIDQFSWFHKSPADNSQPDVAPFFQDPVAARILPFAVFLLTSLVAGAVFDPPSLGYPLRVIFTTAAVLAFIRCLPKTLSFDFDPVSIGAGIGIAVVWLFVVSNAESTPLDEVAPVSSPALVALWIVFRLIGTTFLVPVVEELFFRGYVLNRLSQLPGLSHRHQVIVGVLASSVLFAVLHDALILAFLCGVVFAVLTLRRGRLLDAIIAHAIANGLIGAWALVMNDWSVI